jgi:hypothetical protein
MNQTPDHDDTAQQDDGQPASEPEQEQEREQVKGHGPMKGTDTLATTELEYIDREKGKRTTM